jgi:hypothetical protein
MHHLLYGGPTKAVTGLPRSHLTEFSPLTTTFGSSHIEQNNHHLKRPHKRLTAIGSKADSDLGTFTSLFAGGAHFYGESGWRRR